MKYVSKFLGILFCFSISGFSQSIETNSLCDSIKIPGTRQNIEIDSFFEEDESIEYDSFFHEIDSHELMLDLTDLLKAKGADSKIKDIACGNRREGHLRHARIYSSGEDLVISVGTHILFKNIEGVCPLCIATYKAGATVNLEAKIGPGCHMHSIKVHTKASWLEPILWAWKKIFTGSYRDVFEDAADKLKQTDFCKK